MEQEQSKIKTEYGIDITFVTFEDEKILEEAQIRELQKHLEPVVDKNKEKLVSLVLDFHRVILGQKLNDKFKNEYKEYEYFDTEISRFEVSAIDNYGLILQEINMGTLVLIFYREWIN